MVRESWRSSAASTSSLTSLAARPERTPCPGWAEAVPRPISRWLLPVPESPIKHSDWPLLIQPQPARVLIVAGLIAVLALKSKSARVLVLGKACCVDTTDGAACVTLVALGEQQFGQERPVGELFPAGGISDFGVAVSHGRQPQQPAGAVDRGVDGLLAGLATCHRRAAGGRGCHVVFPLSKLS